MTDRQKLENVRRIKRDKATAFVVKYHAEGYEPEKILGKVWDIWSITGEYVDGAYTLQTGRALDNNVRRWTFAV